MPAVLPFVPAIIGGAASIGSALIGKNASSSAADAQVQKQQQAIQTEKDALAQGQGTIANATGQANDVLSRSAQTQLGMYQPYVQAGQGSLQSLQDLAGANGPLSNQFSFNPSDLEKDPGYAFTLQQGQQAIQRAAAAKGGLFSTGTLKSLAGYTTGTADQYFNSAFQRALSTFDTNRSSALSRINTLQGLAGMGLSGTNAGANAVGSTSAQQANNTFGSGEFNANLNQNTANRIGGYLTGQGNSQAAGIVGGANAINGGIQNGVKAINDFLVGRQLKNSTGGGYSPGALGATYSYPQPDSAEAGG